MKTQQHSIPSCTELSSALERSRPGYVPFMREEFGELDEMDRLFVTVCESVVKPEAFEYAKWKGIGRPTTNRTSVFKAFLFKALYDIPTTRELARRLRRDMRARRLCGWNSAGDVPSEGQFSVVNKEFADSCPPQGRP